MKNMINWFEIAVDDFDRAKTFYESVFQFKMETNVILGYKMGYFSADEGKVSGAIVQGNGYKPSVHGAVVYLNCQPDLALQLSRVESAGGQILVPKTKISDDLGYFAFVIDTEGNKVAFHSMA